MHPDVPCTKSKVMSPDIQGLHYTGQGKEQLRNIWDWAVVIHKHPANLELIQAHGKKQRCYNSMNTRDAGSHSCTAVEAGGRSYRRDSIHIHVSLLLTHTVMSQNSRFNAQVRINLQHKRVDWMAHRTVSTPSLCAEWESSMSEISKRTKEILLYCQ